jgi:hypothetical protein
VFGSAVVVYGGPNPLPLNLTALSGKGFWIDASDRDDLTGLAVAGAGDVNADGYDDVVVGVPGAVTGKGAAFVVFGRHTGADVNLGAPGADGYRINGPESLGWAVAGAGDLNDDGRDDVLVGAPYTATGEVFAVYGKPDTATVDTSALAESGFRIEGLAAHDNAGESVAGNGDINGDHAIDLLVGAAFADPGGLDAAGSAFLLLGIPALQPPPVTPTPPTSPTPAATLTVKARPARKAVPRTGKVKLVRSIRVGTGQTARLSVKVVPKKARKHVRIAKTATSVTARTVRSPKARITVRIRASGTGVTAATWKRTWKVR